MATNSTQIERDAVYGLYNLNYEVKHIAAAMQRSQASIYNWLKSYNVILRTTPRWSKYRKTAHQRNVAIYRNELKELNNATNF